MIEKQIFGKPPQALDRLEAVTSSNRFNSSITKWHIGKVLGINLASVLAILPYCFHMKVGSSLLVKPLIFFFLKLEEQRIIFLFKLSVSVTLSFYYF